MAATLNIDDCTPPRLDKLWDDSYYQVVNYYFSLISLSLSLSLSLFFSSKKGTLSFLCSVVQVKTLV